MNLGNCGMASGILNVNSCAKRIQTEVSYVLLDGVSSCGEGGSTIVKHYPVHRSECDY